MYNVTSNYLTAIKQSSRNLKCKVLVGTTELTEQSVVSFTVESSLGNGNLPSIGGVVASKLIIKFLRDGITPSNFTTQDIKPYIGIEVDGAYTYIPLGVFKPKPQEIKKTDATIEVECTDNLTYLGEIVYTSALNYPATALSVINEIAAQTGIIFANTGSLPSATVKVKPEGMKVRQVLSDLAELFTANAVINRSGHVEFKFLSATTVELTADNYIDFKLLSDDSVQITKLVVEKEDANVEYGSSTGYALSLKNDNITTVAELQTVYNRAFPLTYVSYECKMQGMPHFDAGDTFGLTDKNGIRRVLPILYHKLIYKGGLISEIKADAPKQSTTNSGSTGANSITQSIKTLNVDVQTVQTLLAGNITADNIKANAITADKIATGTITAASGIIANAAITTAKIVDAAITTAKIGDLQVTTAKIVDGNITNAKIANAAIDNAKIANAAIGTANIQTGAITTALIGTSAVGTAQIANASITDAKIVSLTADKIAASTLDTSKVTIQGTNGKLRMANNRIQVFNNDTVPKERISLGDVNGDGTVYGLRVRGADGTTVLLDENGVKAEGITDGSITNSKISSAADIDGSKLLDSSINGSKLVVDAITAKEIAAATITANEIAANTITSANIAAGTITAANIASGTITTTQLASSVGSGLDISSNTSITSNVELINGTNTNLGGRLNTAESSITQLGNQIALKVSQTDYDTLANTVSAHTTQINQTASSITTSVTSLQGQIDSTTGKVDEVRNYMTFDEDGLTLGKDGSNFQVKIDNDSLDFMDGATKVAYVTGQTMYIPKVDIVNEASIAAHKITKYSNDITVITWEG